MEFEFGNVQIKHEELEIIDVQVEKGEEEGEEEPFLGFVESEFEVKLPLFYTNLLLNVNLKPLVPQISDLIENSSGIVDEVNDCVKIKEEQETFEENPEICSSVCGKDLLPIYKTDSEHFYAGNPNNIQLVSGDKDKKNKKPNKYNSSNEQISKQLNYKNCDKIPNSAYLEDTWWNLSKVLNKVNDLEGFKNVCRRSRVLTFHSKILLKYLSTPLIKPAMARHKKSLYIKKHPHVKYVRKQTRSNKAKNTRIKRVEVSEKDSVSIHQIPATRLRKRNTNYHLNKSVTSNKGSNKKSYGLEHKLPQSYAPKQNETNSSKDLNKNEQSNKSVISNKGSNKKNDGLEHELPQSYKAKQNEIKSSKDLSSNEQSIKSVISKKGSHKKTDRLEKELPQRCSAKQNEIKSFKAFFCNDCKFETSVFKAFKIHQYTHSDKRPYACNLCEYRCRNERGLKIHMRKHTGVKPYKCSDCDFKCSFSSTFINHKRRHSDVKPFLCKHCSFKTTIKSSLQRHIETLHGGLINITCSQCEFKCTSQKKLNNHLIVHSGKSYFECSHCDYKHHIQAVVRRHMVTHMDNRMLKCSYCSYRAVHAEYVQRHMAKCHSSTDNYNDSEVELDKENRELNSFDTNSKGILTILDNKYPIISLTRCDGNKMSTLIELTNKKFQDQSESNCNVSDDEQSEVDNEEQDNISCGFDKESDIYEQEDSEIESPLTSGSSTRHGKVNISSSDSVEKGTVLSQETESIHNPLPNISVPINEVIFRKCNETPNKDITTETQDHSLGSISVHELGDFINHNNKKPFICDICKFACSSESSLDRHKLVKHSANKPYKCNLCDFKSAIYQYLKIHMQKHTTSKAFACDMCNFSSDSAQFLETHIKRHELKPFACNRCDFRSNTKGYLKIHEFVHTGETKHICKICNYKAATNGTLKRHMERHSTHE